MASSMSVQILQQASFRIGTVSNVCYLAEHVRDRMIREVNKYVLYPRQFALQFYHLATQRASRAFAVPDKFFSWTPTGICTDINRYIGDLNQDPWGCDYHPIPLLPISADQREKSLVSVCSLRTSLSAVATDWADLLSRPWIYPRCKRATFHIGRWISARPYPKLD
jgi:hypothetical protein